MQGVHLEGLLALLGSYQTHVDERCTRMTGPFDSSHEHVTYIPRIHLWWMVKTLQWFGITRVQTNLHGVRFGLIGLCFCSCGFDFGPLRVKILLKSLTQIGLGWIHHQYFRWTKDANPAPCEQTTQAFGCLGLMKWQHQLIAASMAHYVQGLI